MDDGIFVRSELDADLRRVAATCKEKHCQHHHVISLMCTDCDGAKLWKATYADGLLTLTCSLCDGVGAVFAIGEKAS